MSAVARSVTSAVPPDREPAAVIDLSCHAVRIDDATHRFGATLALDRIELDISQASLWPERMPSRRRLGGINDAFRPREGGRTATPPRSVLAAQRDSGWNRPVPDAAPIG